MPDLMILAFAGLLAGMMNAMAGGGSFVGLPALIAAGLPSVTANASSTLALYPGQLASTWVYRNGLGAVCGVPLRPTFIVTLAGGLVGAVLLLSTPSSLFDRVLPWLLLLATLALAFGRQLGPALRARFRAGLVTVLSIQFVLGVYGGYFGGAVGLMMMAAWGLLDGADVKVMNPARVLLVTAANSVAVLIFIAAGTIAWPQALAMGTGALCGGYAGARLGQILPAWLIRAATIALAAGMTLHFFARAYG